MDRRERQNATDGDRQTGINNYLSAAVLINRWTDRQTDTKRHFCHLWDRRLTD